MIAGSGWVGGWGVCGCVCVGWVCGGGGCVGMYEWEGGNVYECMCDKSNDMVSLPKEEQSG